MGREGGEQEYYRALLGESFYRNTTKIIHQQRPPLPRG